MKGLQSRRRTGPANLHRAALRVRLTAALLAWPGAALAQTQPQAQAAPEAPAAEPGAELKVFLLTVGQGDHIWEKFGHNAIWIRDESRGVDVAYNYGLFSFEQPGFVRKFLKGRMEYSMGGFDAVAMANEYADSNRTLWLQELNLRPGQRVELVRFLEWNARPENRAYRYDYFRDNCSTRVRDALNRVMGGELQEQMEAVVTEATYRTHTQRLTADGIAVSTGLLLAMGHAVDRPLTAWEEGFIPMKLMENARNVTVPGPAGPEPLVLSDQVVFTADRLPERDAAPDRRIPYTAAGLLLGALMVGLARLGHTRRVARAGSYTLVILWSLAAGVFGTIIAMLWAFTDHTDTYRNENLLQAGPLSLLLAGFLVAAAFGKGRRATILAIVVAFLALAGFALQVVPGLDQPNGEIIGLAAPAHLGLALAVAMLARRDPRSDAT